MRRKAAVAGSWYPGSPNALASAIDGYLARVSTDVPAPPRAIVVPHAGLQYSGGVAAHAYAAIAGAQYEAIVLVGPSHFDSFEGVSIWPRGEWETPFGPIAVAEPLAAALMRASPIVHERPSAHAREHSLEMQLPFLARLMPKVPIVPIVTGHQTRAAAEALARALAAVPAGVLLVASSDLSHYEDASTASALDAVVLGFVEALDPWGLMHALEREPKHACGGGPMVSVLAAARAAGASTARVLQYADSGDVTGDKSSVVGYCAAAAW